MFNGLLKIAKSEGHYRVMSKWNRQIWIWVGLAGLMGMVLFFGLRQHPSSFDDAYITYRYAHNIALGRGFVYNIGEPVLGTTTPLYALILAGLSLIWPDIPVLSHYIGMLAWMLCVPVVYGIGQTEKRDIVGIVAAALTALNPLFLMVSGMETSLYVLLILLTFYLHLKEQSIWAALCAGLTFLTRWDGVLVIGTLLFTEMLRHKGACLRASLICALIVIPWLVYSYATFGSIFPNTFYAKVGQGRNWGLGGTEIGSFVRGLSRIAASAYARNRLFVLLPVFWLPGLFSVIYRKTGWWLLLLWTVVYTGGYISLGVLQFTWYYPPLVPGLALLTAEGIEVVARFGSLHLKQRWWRFSLVAAFCTFCLIPHMDWMVKSHKTQMGAHSATYFETGHWLRTHTPPESSVALLEIGIIGFYSDRTIVDTMGLVSPEMVGHLGSWLQTLQFAVNYYWPDYVVALEGTAWMYLVREPWFEEAYVLETQINNSADPVTPVSIYRRRSGFPLQEFVLDSSPQLRFDQAFVLDRIQVVEDKVNPGSMLHVQLTWEAEADIDTDYRLQFDLLNVVDGQRWTLASGLQPMRGGNSTTQWRRGDRVVDIHSLRVPANTSAGSYLLRLIVVGKDGSVPIFDLVDNPVGYVVAGPITIGERPVTAREPAHLVDATFANNIRLMGYDLDRIASDDSLSMTLYWQAADSVPRDCTVFVHLLSPESELITQHDSPPLLPTSLWIPSIQVIDAHTLALPADLPPGEYQIRVGLYHWPDMERVPIVASSDLDEANSTLLLGYISLNNSQAPDG